AGLGGVPNAWGEVKDFRWHRVQRSPHWCPIAEGDRLSAEDLREMAWGGEGVEVEGFYVVQ
ncbi:unnamed protein product, partial [Discosporangium mesarthrocarpum]